MPNKVGKSGDAYCMAHKKTVSLRRIAIMKKLRITP